MFMDDFPSVERLNEQFAHVNNPQELHVLKNSYLGKKGTIQEALKNLALLPLEQRKNAAKNLNELKFVIEELSVKTGAKIEAEIANLALKKSCPDYSLPGHFEFGFQGIEHPLLIAQRDLIALFLKRGFDLGQGPDIETPFFNFEALNIPADHPARQMHDTFYCGPEHLLRTHTSPVQIRYGQNQKPPFKMIAAGRVYRRDDDLTHTPMFHQIEGLLVDQHVSLLDLKELLSDVLSEFFGQTVSLRFRPSFFPFTDPSLEVDISCVVCHGKGCAVCKHSTWLEVLGSGLVHPHVLSSMNINPKEYQAFAFGLGVERLTMLKYQIPDLRMLFDNDFTFLKQFQGDALI